jgi:hypothetical protein
MRLRVVLVVRRAGGCLGRDPGRLVLVLAAHVHYPSRDHPFEQAIVICNGRRRAGRRALVGCAIGDGVREVGLLARGVARGGCLVRGSGRVVARYLTL